MPSNARESPLTDAQIRTIRRRLLRWGRANFQSYAWRVENDPWLSFVAEFLLQRTRASQVEPVFIAMRSRFPTAARLATGGPVAIGELTKTLGLHSRGPMLLRIAEAVADRGGIPPESPAELRRFIGVGTYTTAAWLSLHRNKRATIIDANVARLLSRMTGLPYNRDPRHVQWVQRLAERLTPRRVFRDYNYAVLDFSMGTCTPRNPRCEGCVLKRECLHGRSSASNTSRSRPRLLRRSEEGSKRRAAASRPLGADSQSHARTGVQAQPRTRRKDGEREASPGLRSCEPETPPTKSIPGCAKRNGL